MGALAVLILNDHVLKGAGVLPGVVTGKLSDVAGLLVAPAVLGWVLRVRGRRGWIAVHVAVGVGFAALQLVPGLGRIVDEAAASVGIVMRSWPDPSDLLALPALAISFVMFGRPARRSARTALIGVVALVACTATSAQSPPPRYPHRPGGVVDADVFVRHTGSEDLRIAVRRVPDDFSVDCDALLAAPAEVLREVELEGAQEWTLAQGDGVPLWHRLGGAPTRECYAVRLDARDRQWFVAWRHGTPPIASMSLRLEQDVAAEPSAVVLGAGDELPRVPPGVTVERPL